MGISSVLGSSALLPAGLGFRNLIINGAMQVSQRSTSVTGITDSGLFTADRWVNDIYALGTWTQQTIADAPPGFGNSLKVTCTTANASPIAGALMTLVQRFEGQNLQAIKKGTSSALPLMLSFWVKSNKTGLYVCRLYDNGNNRTVSKTYTIDTAGVWEYKTITIPADTTGTFVNDNTKALELGFWLGAGSNYSSGSISGNWETRVNANAAAGQVNLAGTLSNYFQITGVQMEVNLQPTPFEQRPIGVELALCQRYYINLVSGTGKALGTAYMSGTTTWEAAINFPTYMRTAPTLAYVTGAQYYGVYMLAVEQRVDSMTLDFATPSACRVYGAIVGATSTNGVAGILYTRNASAFLSVQAEL